MKSRRNSGTPTSVTRAGEMETSDAVAKANENIRLSHKKWSKNIKLEEGVIINLEMSNCKDFMSFFKIAILKKSVRIY